MVLLGRGGMCRGVFHDARRGPTPILSAVLMVVIHLRVLASSSGSSSRCEGEQQLCVAGGQIGGSGRDTC